MSKVLYKYSKTSNLALSDTLDKNTDFNAPYSFIDWKVRNVGLIPTREFAQYQEYVKNWYLNIPNVVEQSQTIKSRYIALLREISISFNTDIDQSWIQSLDFDNEDDLRIAIPIFARKLKEIVIYLAAKRESVKKAKLKYSMIGAVQSIERLFYTYLLQAFTKRNYILGVPSLSAFTALPELSAVNKGFKISVAELYDDQQYFDKDPSQTSSFYFDLSGDSTFNFYNTLGFPTSALDWLYSTGFNDTSANNAASWQQPLDLTVLPLSAFSNNIITSELNELNYFNLSKQYLGEKQWIVMGGYYLPVTQSIPFNIKNQNNWFYWPFGEYYKEAETDLNLDPIFLSATEFTNNGTAGNSFYDSDIIFVKKNNIYTGAWLAKQEFNTETKTMSASLDGNAHTIFKFPWPGFGLSGLDIPWSGKSLSNIDKTFEYLSDETQAAIEDVYWSSPDITQTITSIPINNTNLAKFGSASLDFESADKIIIRITNNVDQVHDLTADGNYTGEQKFAWLYKFVKTELPVTIGINTFLWPITRLDTTTTLLSTNLPTTCAAQYLSALPITGFNGSTASPLISTSDQLYKLDAFDGSVTELAWLSGAKTSLGNTIQSNFNIKIDAGDYAIFEWTGPDGTNASSVFKYFPHATSCPCIVNPIPTNLLSQDIINYNTELGTNRWQYCTCGSYSYSPCGHSGLYTDFFSVADFIVLENDFLKFDLNSWRDNNNHPYYNSAFFGWYRTIANDIGYGSGQFVAGDNSDTSFLLRTGSRYRYYRTNLKRDVSQFFIPYLVEKYTYPTAISKPPVWASATKQTDNTWLQNNALSPLILAAGDVVYYNHVSSASAINSNTILNPTVNFSINTPLISATPYWAVASDSLTGTAGKGFPVYGGDQYILDDYTIMVQPIPSNTILNNDTYIDYERIGNTFIWVQDVEVKTFVNQNQWKVLEFSSLFDPLTSTSASLAISATSIPSNIILEPFYNDIPVLVNYFARNDFTATQILTSSTLGSPPSGGTWVEPVSSVYVDPLMPYANLTNRHYPTVAMVPTLDKLYSEEDSGGYFIPKGLGISTYLTHKFSTEWKT